LKAQATMALASLCRANASLKHESIPGAQPTRKEKPRDESDLTRRSAVNGSTDPRREPAKAAERHCT